MSCRRTILLGALLTATGGVCKSEPPRDREADAMQEKGAALLDSGRYDEAASELRAAIERHRRAADHAAASIDADRLSHAHREMSRYIDMLRWAETARAEAAMSGDDNLLGRALNWLGNALQIIGDDERAADVYAEAAAHLREEDRAEHARMKIYRAIFLNDLKRSAEAEQLLEEGREIARKAGDRKLTRAASTNLANIELHDGRLEEAARDLADSRAVWVAEGGRTPPRGLLINEAILARKQGDLTRAAALLDEAAAGGPPEATWIVENERGIVAEAAGRPDEAERRYGAAISIIEEMRQTSAPREVKAPFLETRWEPYQRLFALQVKRGGAQHAFATLVEAQGRMFLDTLAVSLADTRSASASPDRVEGAIQRMGLLEELVPLLARSALGDTRPPEGALATLRSRHVRHVLAYFADGERMRLLAVVDGEPRITSVDIDLERLERLVGDLRARPDDERGAAALSAALLPADAMPPGPGRLHVVPTGPLLRVPFATLRVAGERLLDRYEIAYAPSVTALAAMANDLGDVAGPGVVIADSRSNLQSAAAELREVVASTGAIARTGTAATAGALRAAARAPLLHIISHSGLDHRGGYVVLADRRITAADIINWRIRPRLAVLPTCASAATVRGEMWDSLAAAFLASGSAHVVATLASVEDRVAAEFAGLFYRHGGLTDPVGATARAQREMARTHPASDWSAFVVAGL